MGRKKVKQTVLKQADPQRAMLARGMSLQTLMTFLGDTKSHSTRELNSSLDFDTPYGKLFAVLQLPLADGSGTYEWIVCNPFALLWL